MAGFSARFPEICRAKGAANRPPYTMADPIKQLTISGKFRGNRL
jgi:hypothetical protein